MLSNNKSILNLVFVALLLFSFTSVFADDHNHDEEGHNHEVTSETTEAHAAPAAFDAGEMIMHHIADANEFHIFGNLSLPLPVILYTKDAGVKFMLSSAFQHGKTAVDGFVLDHGVVKRITDAAFPAGHVDEIEVHHGEVSYGGHHYATEGKQTLLASSSFYDFSITKNVFTMLLAALILCLLFIGMARSYKKGNIVPKGIGSALEPIILFIRDDIAMTNIGKNYKKFLPYLLTVFFFILVLNLLGLIPFFPGSANVTGNIAITIVLAVITMIITNVNGNKAYWSHIFWPPVPWWLKPLMIPIEIIGVLTKPFALMIRLFANISAGHILILSLLSLIFIFNSVLVAPVSIAFVIFMSLLEILVAFLQAYIFTLLSALFIGLAQEEHH